MLYKDKFLLLQDLCARLPYGVIVKLDDKFKFNKGDRVLVKELLDLYCVEGIKPYLRPMSSMTEEEANEWAKVSNMQFDMEDGFFDAYDAHLSVDWLNAHHFDYRGLIEKGLALVALEGMYIN